MTPFLIKSQWLEKATAVPANFLCLSVKRKICCNARSDKQENDIENM